MIRFGPLLALLLLATPVSAGFQECLGELRARAASAGVSARTIESATRDLTFDPDLLAFETAQPEFKTPIWDYLAGLVDDERVNDGRAQMHQWAHALSVAESRYGVDANTIAAVWGVESISAKTSVSGPLFNRLRLCPAKGGGSPIFAANSSRP